MCIRDSSVVAFLVILKFQEVTTITVWVVQINLFSIFLTNIIAANVIQRFYFVTGSIQPSPYQNNSLFSVASVIGKNNFASLGAENRTFGTLISQEDESPAQTLVLLEP